MADDNSKVIDLKKSTDIVEFKPTAAMQVWVDTAVRIISDSPTEIANESGLDKSNWYKWCKEVPQFEEWYYEMYRKKRTRWIPKLDRIGMKHAVDGSYNHWKDMNKKAGENLDSKTPQTAVQVNNNFSGVDFVLDES